MSTKTARAADRAPRLDSPDRLGAGATLAWTTTASSAAVNFVILGYWVFYGTDVLGLDPALLGTLALLSKLLEAVAVVVAGWLVDRSPETRWGKARPYELAIIGVWASTALLFATPDLGDAGKAIWLFVCLCLVNVVFTSLLGANDVLYLARAFRGRVVFAKVATRTGFLTVLSTIAFSAVLPILVAQAGTSASAWATTILFIAVPMALLGLGRFVFVREKHRTEAVDAPKVTFRDIRDVLRSNRYIWIVGGITFASTIAQGSGITVYYFRWIVGDIALMSLTALVPIVILPAMLAFPRLMRRVGVSRIITWGALSALVGSILLIFSGGSVPLVLVSTLLSGIGVLPITFLTQVLILDNATFNQWSGRRRLESTMGAINNFASRLAGGLGGGIVGWVLAIAGYDGSASAQSASATTGILVLAGGAPALLWLGVIVVMRLYRRLELMLPTITQELAVVLARQDVDAPVVERPRAARTPGPAPDEDPTR